MHACNVALNPQTCSGVGFALFCVLFGSWEAAVFGRGGLGRVHSLLHCVIRGCLFEGSRPCRPQRRCLFWISGLERRFLKWNWSTNLKGPLERKGRLQCRGAGGALNGQDSRAWALDPIHCCGQRQKDFPFSSSSSFPSFPPSTLPLLLFPLLLLLFVPPFLLMPLFLLPLPLLPPPPPFLPSTLPPSLYILFPLPCLPLLLFFPFFPSLLRFPFPFLSSSSSFFINLCCYFLCCNISTGLQHTNKQIPLKPLS